jgi:hypothetical protein
LSMEGGTLAFLCHRPPLVHLEQCRPGDVLVLEPLEPPHAARGTPNIGRQMADELSWGAWRMVESAATKEVFQSGKLRVFQVLPGAGQPAVPR